MSDFHCDVVNLNRNKRESSGNESNCLIQKKKICNENKEFRTYEPALHKILEGVFSLKKHI